MFSDSNLILMKKVSGGMWCGEYGEYDMSCCTDYSLY